MAPSFPRPSACNPHPPSSAPPPLLPSPLRRAPGAWVHLGVALGLMVVGAALVPGAGALKVYVVGDSLVDTGNANYLRINPIQPACNWKPYGIDLSPSRPTGRWSNGKIFLDFLAERLGIPLPPNSLQPNATFENGVNMAIAGCPSVADSPVRVTVCNGYKMVDALGKIIAARTPPGPPADAFVVFNLGPVDYVNFFLSRPSFLFLPTAAGYAKKIVAANVAHLKAIYSMGFRKFAVSNVPPVGCTPAVQNVALFSPSGCLDSLNTAVQMYNRLMEAAVDQLRTNLTGSTFFVLDLYAGSFEISRLSGIPMNSGACCGFPAPKNGLAQCAQGLNLCKNRTQHLYWDLFHPTEYATSLQFELAWSGNTTFVRPQNISTVMASL